MTYAEKSAWILVVVTVGVYGIYLAGLAAQMNELPDVAYEQALLWSVAAYIAATIVLHILAGILSPKAADQEDQRDKEIYRFGEYVGQYFSGTVAFAALLMALAEWDHFWIANTIYVAFGGAVLLANVVKIVAYRRGFQQW